MSDDTNVDGRSDWRPNEQECRTDGGPPAVDPDSPTKPISRAEWEQLPADPDPGTLGYELSEWEQFSAIDGTDQIMFLPEDEAVLREDAFVVAEDGAICDLENRC